MKKDAALGKDGVTVDMMSADMLFDVWCALFGVCSEYGMVPSVWRESLGFLSRRSNLEVHVSQTISGRYLQ